VGLIEEARQQKEKEARQPVEPKLQAIITRAQKNIAYRLLTESEGFGVGFGQLVPSAGFSAGPRYQRTLLDGRMRLRWSLYGSTKQYYTARFTASLPDLARGRAGLDFSTSHSDFPQMPYYGPGPDSRRSGRSDFRIENTQVDVRPTLRPVKHVLIGAFSGFRAINVGPGTSEKFISTDLQYSPAQAPGVQRQTNYLEGGGFFEFDWRDRRGEPTAGGRYRAEYSRLSDQDVGRYSFYRFNLDAQQYVPLFNGKRVLALHGASWFTDTNRTQTVPFYMQPVLGGPDTLRGFRTYRFYDNNALLLQGEYRWEASSVLDMALFADGGKVFHNWQQWNLHNIEGSYGFGIRIKSPDAVALRIDVGFSHEGFQLWFRVRNPF
jgi:hypothetical protein